MIRSHECGKPIPFSRQGYPQLILIIGTQMQGDIESNFQMKFLVRRLLAEMDPLGRLRARSRRLGTVESRM